MSRYPGWAVTAEAQDVVDTAPDYDAEYRAELAEYELEARDLASDPHLFIARYICDPATQSDRTYYESIAGGPC